MWVVVAPHRGDGIPYTEPVMLADVALKNLKPRPKPYKVTDRDGMYAHVSPSGTISFRYDYRLHGRDLPP